MITNSRWWMVWFILPAAILLLPGAGWSDDSQVALMTTEMVGVGDDEKVRVTEFLWKVLGEYHPLLPGEQVRAAEQRAQAAGCEGEACLQAVRENLGVSMVYRLKHVDEGYFNHLYMTRATSEGFVHKDYICSRCSFPEYQVILRRLLRHMHHK